MPKKAPKAIEHRRAEIAKLRVQRLTTREIAERLDLSQSMVQRDLDALAVDWAKNQGDFEAQLAETLRDVDAVQAVTSGLMESLSGVEQLQAADRVLKAVELRARLLNMFPKPGADADPLQSGPITLKLELVEKGNQPLVTKDAGIAIESGEVIEHE